VPGSICVTFSGISSKPSVLDRFELTVAGKMQRHTDIFPPVFLLSVAERDAHRQRDQPVGPRAGKPTQQWFDYTHEGDEHRDRIARQADKSSAVIVSRATDHAHRHRPPRLDGDTPEHQAADAFDRGAHMIGFAGGDAAGGDDEIVRGGGSAQRVGKVEWVVGQNTEIGHLRAKPRQQAREEITVGVENSGVIARCAGLDHLIAGRKNRHFQPPPHLDFGHADRGGERDVLRVQHRAGDQHDCAFRRILTSKAPVRAAL
jgi:hypothetical protein